MNYEIFILSMHQIDQQTTVKMYMNNGMFGH